MLFCSISIALSAHGRIRQISMYFPRYLIGYILTAYFAVVIKYLGKYLTICLILSWRKKQSISDKIAFLYFTLIRFRGNNSLKSVLIAVSRASDW